MVKKSLLLLVPLLLSCCELFMEPEHSNPFDSMYNPAESGGPSLALTESPGQIDLRWARSHDSDFSQYVMITSVVREEIREAVLDPDDYLSHPSIAVLPIAVPTTDTNLSVSTAGLTGLHHYAVIYQRTGTSAPKASNIVTYEP